MNDKFEYGKHVIIITIIGYIQELEGTLENEIIEDLYGELECKSIHELVEDLGHYYELLNDK